MLLINPGDEPYGLPPALLQAIAYFPPPVSLPAFPDICLLIICPKISSLPLPTSWVPFLGFSPLCCVLVFSSLFIVQFFHFFLQGVGGVSLSRGLCWFIPGMAGGIPCDTWCSPVWSAECLPSRFGASSGSGSPPVFSV
jgi:hypothetical protein